MFNINSNNNNNNNNNANSFHANANNIMNAAQQKAQSNRVKVSISGWQGASYTDAINFISRKMRVAVKDSFVEGQLIIGYVDNNSCADELIRWSGVRFAGNALILKKLDGFNSNLGSNMNNGNINTGNAPMSNNLMLLTSFFYSRYNAQMKMLNLSALHQDQQLISTGLMNMLSTPTKLYPALMKIALNEKKKGVVVETIDLSLNNLKDVFCLNTLYEVFPDLKNLSLANNNIEKLTSLEQWKNKFNKLREMILINNPVTQQQQYKNAMIKIFPKLILLDSVVVRDETKLNSIFQIEGFPQKQFFFENNDAGQYASGFVSNYLNLWDTNRQQLMGLYQEQSQFSLSTDASIPSSTVEDADQTVSMGYYTALSRNAMKVSTEKLKDQRLGLGQQKIYELFQSIPQTKHSLVENPEAYSVQCLTYSAVNGFIITLHGHFEEINKPANDTFASTNTKKTGFNNRNRRYNTSSPSSSESNKLSKKSFDRTWVVIPQNGSVIIASDLLTIRAYSKGSWIKKAKPEPQQQQQQQQQQHQQGQSASQDYVTPPSSMGMNTPLNNQIAGTLQLDPTQMAKLNPVQLQLVNRIHLETKLNGNFALILCEQSGWQYDVAIKGFQASINSLPRDAFVA